MYRWRIAGLMIVALPAAWLALRGCSSEEPQPAPSPPPAREAFHASKPIRVEVVAGDESADLTWLESELRYLLSRGRMRVAPVGSDAGSFILRVEVARDPKFAEIALLAPDRIVERRENVTFADQTRLATLSAITAPLPQFLRAAHAPAGWATLIGTDDAKAYETFLDNAADSASRGYTRPVGAAGRARVVERLESLTRRHPRFARAWGALASAYLSLGGQDETSLAQLARSGAVRALTIDDGIAEAHAALGLVHLRRNEWIAARERFERALKLDVNNAPALEGFACLLVDAGRHEAARPIAERALLLQPSNAGARECLAYAGIGTSVKPPLTNASGAPLQSAPATRLHALATILEGDLATARRLLRSSLDRRDFALWAEPLLRAAANRRHIPDALRAVTRAASEGLIDSSTEILCGAALRQTEFVFNRMSRLQRQRKHVPLRILWAPQTAFLREHLRFEEIIDAAGLPALWQEHGMPDVCNAEPAVYGCRMSEEKNFRKDARIRGSKNLE